MVSLFSEIRILNLNCVTGCHKSRYDHCGVLWRNPDALNCNSPLSAVTTWKTRELLKCKVYFLAGTQIVCDSSWRRSYLGVILKDWKVAIWRMLKCLFKFPVCDDKELLQLAKWYFIRRKTVTFPIHHRKYEF